MIASKPFNELLILIEVNQMMKWSEIMPNVANLRRQALAWRNQFDAVAPKEGDLAPDFKLFDVNGEYLVRMSDFRGRKPIALIFGSYT